MHVLVVALTTVTVYGFGPLHEHCVIVASPGEACSAITGETGAPDITLEGPRRLA